MAGFDAGRVIQAYGAGVQDRQQRERTSALSAYGGAAARGDQNAIDALSAAAPDLGIRFAEHAAGMQDAERKRSLETWDWVGSALLKQDGTPITDQADLDRVKTLAKARGIDPKLVDGVSLENVPNLIQFSQTARNYQRQASQDQLQRRVAEANINQSNAAADASRASAARGAGGASGGNAPAGYQWVRGENGSVSLAPITGGPADPNRIAPGEGVKVRASNAQLDALEQSLNNYLTDLGKTSSFGRVVSRGPEVSKVETGHTDLLMQMKNLYELGVLNGPDYMLMTKIVEDPTSFMQLARGTEGLKAQTDTVKSIIARSRNINNAKLGLSPTSGAPGAVAPTDTPIVKTQAEYDALPSGAIYVESDGKRYRKP